MAVPEIVRAVDAIALGCLPFHRPYQQSPGHHHHHRHYHSHRHRPQFAVYAMRGRRCRGGCAGVGLGRPVLDGGVAGKVVSDAAGWKNPDSESEYDGVLEHGKGLRLQWTLAATSP